MKIVLEEPDTNTAQVVCHDVVDANFRDPLFGDTAQFMKEITHEKPDIDLLLKSMDHEIFADFKKNLDSGPMEDFSILISTV